MRILGTIIRTLIVDVLSRQAEGSNGDVIGPEFIGCNPGGCPALFLQQLARVAQVSGNRRTKLEEPAPYALVGNIQTPLRKEILHIPIAQSEPGQTARRMISGGKR